MAEDLLEAVQIGGKAPGEPVAEVGRDRGVLGTRSPGRSRIDGEVAEHRAQCLAWPLAEYLARDHEHLAAVEVIEKRRELEPVHAGPEVAVVAQGQLRPAPLRPADT
jgi:hypothetical protein